MKQSEARTGMYVLVKTAHESLAEGCVVRILKVRFETNLGYGEKVHDPETKNVGGMVHFSYANVEPLDRATKLSLFEKKLQKAVEDRRKAEFTEAKVKQRVDTLKQFSSDEDEMKYILKQLTEVSGTPEERFEKVSKMLEGRVKTDYMDLEQ